FEARQEEAEVNGSLDARQRQSGAVQSFVADALAGDANANIVVLGDFNEFEFISPLLDLEASGLVNLTNTLAADERYTFNFQGNSQTLDHILVSGALGAGAVLDQVHVNSEFADVATRASDHDPVVAGVTLGEQAPSQLELALRGVALGPGAAFDAQSNTFTFVAGTPGLGRVLLEFINRSPTDASGVYFLD
ncbi:MAG: endonuclease/exonuclease/phosphatase family protein, partial [Pseudomonadota bacterium]